MKNTHEGVLLFNKVGGFSLQFTQSTTSLYVFFTFFKLHKWYQIAQNVSVKVSRKNMDLSELQFPSISENQFRNLKHIGDYWPAYKILFNMCLQAFKTYIVENFCQICKIKCTFHSPKTRFLWVTKINTGNFTLKVTWNVFSKLGKIFIVLTTIFIIFWDFLIFYQIFLSRLLLINTVYTSWLTSCRTT